MSSAEPTDTVVINKELGITPGLARTALHLVVYIHTTAAISSPSSLMLISTAGISNVQSACQFVNISPHNSN